MSVCEREKEREQVSCMRRLEGRLIETVDSSVRG